MIVLRPVPSGWNADGPYSSAVEHFLGKEEVTGSSPVMGSIFCLVVMFETRCCPALSAVAGKLLARLGNILAPGCTGPTD